MVIDIRSLRPSQIRFSQDSVANRFKNPRDPWDLNECVDLIVRGQLTPQSFPVIKVFYKDNKLYSLDNRRLYVFRAAEVLGVVGAVSVKIVTPWANLEDRFTTVNDGIKVRVRRGVTKPHYKAEWFREKSLVRGRKSTKRMIGIENPGYNGGGSRVSKTNRSPTIAHSTIVPSSSRRSYLPEIPTLQIKPPESGSLYNRNVVNTPPVAQTANPPNNRPYKPTEPVERKPPSQNAKVTSPLLVRNISVRISERERRQPSVHERPKPVFVDNTPPTLEPTRNHVRLPPPPQSQPNAYVARSDDESSRPAVKRSFWKRLFCCCCCCCH